MNWRDVPHLFYNFDCILNNGHLELKTKISYILSEKEEGWDNFDKTTLIARKIEDMADKEIQKQFPRSNRQELSDAINNDEMFADDFLYLLSIGVYPFDQKDFETGIVIKEIKNGKKDIIK